MQTILWLKDLDCVWLHWVKVRLERWKPLWICSQDLTRCYLFDDQIDAKQQHNYVFVIVHYKSAYRDLNFLTQISLLKIAITISEWLKTMCKGNEREIVSSRRLKGGFYDLWQRTRCNREIITQVISLKITKKSTLGYACSMLFWQQKAFQIVGNCVLFILRDILRTQ